MAIKNLFTEVEKVLSNYKVQAEELDKQEQELNAELIALQEEMTAIILDLETAGSRKGLFKNPF